MTKTNQMIFSKACEYGIRASVYIAHQSANKQRVSLKDIAHEIDSPEAFTAKILQMLARKHIVISIKGATGGFEISQRQLSKIKLWDVVKAIDGDLQEKSCVLGLKKCSEVNPCPVHHKFKHIKTDIVNMMRQTTLLEMSDSIEKGLSWLKIESN